MDNNFEKWEIFSNDDIYSYSLCSNSDELTIQTEREVLLIIRIGELMPIRINVNGTKVISQYSTDITERITEISEEMDCTSIPESVVHLMFKEGACQKPQNNTLDFSSMKGLKIVESATAGLQEFKNILFDNLEYLEEIDLYAEIVYIRNYLSIKPNSSIRISNCKSLKRVYLYGSWINNIDNLIIQSKKMK